MNAGSDTTLLAAMGTLLPSDDDSDDDTAKNSPSPPALSLNKTQCLVRQRTIDQIFPPIKVAQGVSAAQPVTRMAIGGSGSLSSHVPVGSHGRGRSDSDSGIKIISGYEFDRDGPFGPRPRNIVDIDGAMKF